MEIVCRRRSDCQKEPWFGKSSSFACFMGYFQGSCSGTIKSSEPRCICLVRLAQTVLVWQISDLDSEAATRGALSKKVFLKISQNSQENTCVRVSFLIQLKASVQFLRTSFLQNTLGRLLLLIPQSQWVYIAMGCSFMVIW